MGSFSSSHSSSSSCLIMVTLLLISFFIQFSNCSNNNNNLISKSCKEASETDPKNLSYDFCVDSLIEYISKNQSSPPPNSIEDLLAISINITKSNGTNIISKISKLLRNNSSNKKHFIDPYARGCLKDCFDLYQDSLSDLEEAATAFRSKDFDTAAIKLSAALDDPVTCEDQFKDKKGVTSPLTKDNKVYFQLNIITLAFTQMCNKHI